VSKLSVREAAYRVGVTRQTLFKYIREGKVSATVGHEGQKQVDVSELLRVFGELQPDTGTDGHSSDRRPLSQAKAATATTTALQVELERMKTELHFKEKELALAKERIDELKARETEAKHREREGTEERLRLLGVVEQQNRLLAAPIKTPAPAKARRPAAPAPMAKVKPTKKATAPAPAPTAKVKPTKKAPAPAPAPTAKVKPTKKAPAPMKKPTRKKTT
jgi:FtsZ-binding cell division protein ZapB